MPRDLPKVIVLGSVRAGFKLLVWLQPRLFPLYYFKLYFHRTDRVSLGSMSPELLKNNLYLNYLMNF